MAFWNRKINIALFLFLRLNKCAKFQNSSEDPVLHVQHCVPVHDDVQPHGARLLPAPGLGREDCPGCHRYPRLQRLHARHRREDARDQ